MVFKKTARARVTAQAIFDEEMKYCKKQMKQMMKDPTRRQLSFPLPLTKKEHKKLKIYASEIGLKVECTKKGNHNHEA